LRDSQDILAATIKIKLLNSNSKTITTVDTMLEVTVNMKRYELTALSLRRPTLTRPPQALRGWSEDKNTTARAALWAAFVCCGGACIRRK
jgi:anionic cell wall polymer biosynthesis LytR-Cps2A-Psr (LCP) family protein